MDKNEEFCKQLGIDPKKVWHVFPFREAKQHTTKGIADCPCNPTLKIEASKRVNIIHKAFDGSQDLDIPEDILALDLKNTDGIS